MEWLDGDLLWPIVGSGVAGAVIGGEREYRGSPAGFRTHILMCLSSALLMLAAVHQVRWLSDTPDALVRIDPVRMAHGILTGIGFLCGGVIFREGFNIRGLTTAASLWMTSALGILFGVGFYGLAIGGTVASLLVLAALTVKETLMPQRQFADLSVRYRREAIRDADRFRALLTEHHLKPITVGQSLRPDAFELSAKLSSFGDLKADSLTGALRADPDVVGFDIQPHKT